jgi:cysteine-rich CPXCG protein
MQDNAEIQCPYCGEMLDISLDPSIRSQTYIEDCQVCCKPIQIRVIFEYGEANVQAEPLDT